MALGTSPPALRYHVVRNTFGRWMIVNPRDPELAWSGGCWVEHEDGVSRGRDRVMYFDSQEDAEQHAHQTWGTHAGGSG